MVVAQQVEHAVQHQDLDFLLDGVAEFARLRAGAPQRNGDVAQEAPLIETRAAHRLGSGLSCPGAPPSGAGNESTSVA